MPYSLGVCLNINKNKATFGAQDVCSDIVFQSLLIDLLLGNQKYNIQMIFKNYEGEMSNFQHFHFFNLR